ncbi:ATP-binding protein [Macrococcus brunensis]|uniref:ATP-binding protein n=1 Tax=Macrococcus brunensis TaxID=198483 RepID=A0A4R6BBF8_9STAP|nr:ATP-binding protein [Macrococcus brunensis]TDL94305.1 ATP-binding protein [Macrococcus brunensis]
MSENLFIEEIKELIELRYEGSYWDYKLEHHSKENNHKLLHDIICLANNMENRDAYLIIGVSDDGELVGFNNESFRRNQQQLNDYVRTKKWEGYGAPDIKLQTITIDDVEIDIIIIPKSTHVPFTLAEDVKPKGQGNVYLRSRTIYTRNQDSNTSHKGAASITEVENLMKYRLGLLPDPIERIRRYLNDVNNWKLMNSNADGMSWYYLLHPEFTVEMIDEYEAENSMPLNFSFVHMNGRSSMLRVNVKFHSTVLYWDYARYIDEARGIVIYPSDSALNVFKFGGQFTNRFNYYIRDSIKLQLSLFLMKLQNLDSEGWLWERHLSYIPVFTDEDEVKLMKFLINQNPEQAKSDVIRYKEEVSLAGYNTGLTDEEYKFVKQDLATNLMVIEKLKQYRMNV